MKPRATYRLQLHAGFGFDAAAAVVPYLAALGISHVYCSPYLQPVPGSTHGYDVVDPTRVSADLGGEAAHERFCRALAEAGLGQVLDIVPNHMAAHPANPWWWDVLEHGRSSPYAAYFDIDWDPPEHRLRDRILLPVLPDHYGRVLDAGGIAVATGPDGRLEVRAGECRFPVAPGSTEGLLPAAASGDRVALHELLERQHYRLAWWRMAAEHLDYRRFFDVDTLVALRAEDEAVFGATHALVLGWLEDGTLDGVRVDHPDGLRDPGAYAARLRAAAPTAWVVMEKILAPGERLAAAWPVDGTTGYDALNLVAGLFVDPAGEAPLTDLYRDLTGERSTFAETARVARREALERLLGSDLHRLTHRTVRLCEQHVRHRDHTRSALRDALVELVVDMPVYRTYGDAPVAAAEVIGALVAGVATRCPDIDGSLLAFLEEVLTGGVEGVLGDDVRAGFGQLAAPVAAKGVEDTAFYRYLRFVALNEVGGAPDRFGVSVDEFHAECRRLARDWPGTMTALSTHDTKRSEDVRARLFVLSEEPDVWEEFARRWVDPTSEVDAATQYALLQNLVGAWPLPADRAHRFALKAVREAKQRTSWTDPDPVYEAAVHRWVDDRSEAPTFAAAVEALVGALEPAATVNSLAQKLVQLLMPGVPDVYQGCELEDRSLVDPDNRRAVDWDERGRLVTLSPADLASVSPKLLVVRAALDVRRRLGDLGDYGPLAAADGVLAFTRADRVAVAVPVRGPRVPPAIALPPGEWRDLLPALPVRLLERVG